MGGALDLEAWDWRRRRGRVWGEDRGRRGPRGDREGASGPAWRGSHTSTAHQVKQALGAQSLWCWWGAYISPMRLPAAPPQVPPPPALGCTSPPLPGFRFETTFTALVSWPMPRPPCPHPSLSLRPPLLHALSSPHSFPAHFFPQSSSLCFSLGLEPPHPPPGLRATRSQPQSPLAFPTGRSQPLQAHGCCHF